PLERQRPYLFRAGSLDTGTSTYAMLIRKIGQQAHIRCIGNKDFSMGPGGQLPKQAIQVGSILSKRCTVSEVIADKPDGDECRMVSYSLRQLLLQCIMK